MTINELLAELEADEHYPFTLEELRRLDEADVVKSEQVRRLVAEWARRNSSWLERHGLVLLAMPADDN